jgi:hypothetical protein
MLELAHCHVDLWRCQSRPKPLQNQGQAVQSPTPPRALRLFGRSIPMPASRIGRIALGVLLVLLGCLGFLPVLGFWMIPLGLLVLSHDVAPVRRFRRRIVVWYEKRRGTRQKTPV